MQKLAENDHLASWVMPYTFLEEEEETGQLSHIFACFEFATMKYR